MVKLLYVVVTIVLTVLLTRESEIIKGLDSNVKIYWLTFMVLIIPLSESNKIIIDKVTISPYLPLFVENILSSQVTIAVLGMMMLIIELNLIIGFLQQIKLIKKIHN